MRIRDSVPFFSTISCKIKAYHFDTIALFTTKYKEYDSHCMSYWFSKVLYIVLLKRFKSQLTYFPPPQ